MKINGLKWKIEYVDEDSPILEDDYMGLCNFLEQKIYLRKGMSKKLTERTLIHEVIHAIIFSYGMDGDMDEERLCDFISAHFDEIQKILSEV